MDSAVRWLEGRPFAYGMAIALCVCLLILPFSLFLGRGWSQPLTHSVVFGLTTGLVRFIKDRQSANRDR